MKELLKKIILLFSLSSFKLALFFTAQKKIVFIDIDNTVSATSGYLISNGKIRNMNDYMKIDRLNGTFKFLEENFKKTHRYIFLSHRRILSFNVTRKWLKKQSLWGNDSKLYLVSNPLHKIYFFKTSISNSKDITIIDDLSFNHENGEILYYNEVINFINKNNIKYYDYSFIKSLN